MHASAQPLTVHFRCGLIVRCALRSLCSIEHVGSIKLGQQAVLDSLTLLKPGGVAFHTVEFQLASLETTVEHPGESVWRKKDMERLIAEAKRRAYIVPRVEWGAGEKELDRERADNCFNPGGYRGDDHVKLSCDGITKTSYAMVIQRAIIEGGNAE